MAQLSAADGCLRDYEEIMRAIDDGDVEPPPLLTWKEWLSWRSEAGLRPTVRRGFPVDETTSLGEESRTWRQLMAALHGPEWQRDLAAVGGADSQVDDKRSEGSGGAVSEAGLRKQLAGDYDPGRESPEVYRGRMARTLEVLGVLGVDVGVGLRQQVECRIAVAGEETSGHRKVLKELFVRVLTEDMDEEERTERLGVLTEWLEQVGVRLSKKSDRMFSPGSTPQLTPERLAAQQESYDRTGQPNPLEGWLKSSPDPERQASVGKKREREEVVTPRSKKVDQSEAMSSSPGQELADAIREQTKVITKVLEGKKENLSSTIRINPSVTWPKLADEGPDSREVSEFFDKFDETCGLANDGRGMTASERLTVLASCLKGTRAKTYKNLHKKFKALGEVESDPAKVEAIKAKADEVRRDTDRKADESLERV